MIAPVQAFIMKQLLLENDMRSWKEMSVEQCNLLLVTAMTEIVAQAADSQKPRYCIVHTVRPDEASVVCQSAASGALDPKSSSDEPMSGGGTTENRMSLEPDVFHSQLR